jgi:tetratricopeptide (TPR) repeat protein
MPASESLDEAVIRCQMALDRRPDDPQAFVALGTALWQAGQRGAAVEVLSRAVDRHPDCGDACNNLGNALAALGRLDEAIARYRAGLEARPDMAELHYNLGNALLAAGSAAEGEVSYRRALALDADHVGAHNNLGNALRMQGRHGEAIACYRQTLARRPDFYGTLNNIGSALLGLHRPDEAVPYFERALKAAPDYAEASNNLGGALLTLGQPDQALSCFRRALELDAGQVQARLGEGLALLSIGRFREGWTAYEARWEDPDFQAGTPSFPDEPWRGSGNLAGRTILLHAEQGLGDTIQFARFAPVLRARGARVVLQVQAPLVGVLGHLADAVLAQGSAKDPLSRYDLHCPLLSLPLALGIGLETIPADIPYVLADGARAASWAACLPSFTGRRVAVAFSGSAEHPDDALRSIPASRLLPALRQPCVELHVVQRDIGAADAEWLRGAPDTHVHADRLADFAETAALLSCMDLVVCVDTSLAHLAGAMGLPVWTLVQVGADFRWMTGRADTPWYPTMRLFRQTAWRDWEPAIAQVSAALRDWSGASGVHGP